ncbi:MAG TPA: beta-propeller fold lactonase family protein [Pyrinomonadaceae bacterium]|nr:beta-propeller fold lactonase family protein [Pyrinomonadaceae bacterium]
MLEHVITNCFAGMVGWSWVRAPRRSVTTVFFFFLALLVTFYSQASSALAQGTLTKIDSEVVPSPGDNMVVAVRKSGTFVVTLSRDTDSAYTHRLESDSTLTPIGTSPTGDGPLAVALARKGEFAVVANSLSNDLSVMTIGPTGLLQEVNRVPSGGVAPSDVGVVFDDLIIVANRGALTGEGEGVTLFEIDRNGNVRPIGDLTPTGAQPPLLTGGNDPHIVAVGWSGLVAVANSSSNDLTLFDVDRRGNMVLLPPISRPVGGSPKALAFSDNSLFVATRSAQFGAVQDQIEVYHVARDGTLTLEFTTDAGYFLTDIEANEDGLFAVTWSSPTTGALELRAYDTDRKGGLSLNASLQLPNVRSFQQVFTHPGRRPVDRHVVVTQFQANAIHSVVWWR